MLRRLVSLQAVAQHLPLLASWHHKQWGYLNPGQSLTDREQKMQVFLQDGYIPVTYVALQGETPLGSAALVHSDMDSHAELSPWLASVYVAPQYRCQGLGAALVRRVVAEAQALGVPRVHLFTPDKADYYRRLGWQQLGKEIYRGAEVTVMVYLLAAG